MSVIIFPSGLMKTVVVLGASYGGARAARILATNLPNGWRVILIDKNSHMNHLYVMPRFAVLPGHEYKAFIPYTNVFRSKAPGHILLQAQVMSIHQNHIVVSKPFPELGIPTTAISFEYAVYALGARLPPPLNLWESPIEAESSERTGNKIVRYLGSKEEGCEWLRSKQKLIERVPTVLVVGGGALGIQFATDIKDIYPSKKVTLLHSRLRLLPKFDERMHYEILKSCEDMGVEVILGERLDLDSLESAKLDSGLRAVRTIKGREIAADLILLCIGQTPNTELLKEMDPSTVRRDNGLARVLRTMQLYSQGKREEPTVAHTAYPHIFAIGDSADAFGAIQAGHTASAQAEIAAVNILRLINRSEAEARVEREVDQALEHYNPGPPGIKISLGLKRNIRQTGPEATVVIKEDGVPDLNATYMWPIFGMTVEKDEDMIP